MAAIVATMAFMLGAMFAAAHRKPELADDTLKQKADFMDAYPGAMLRFDHEDKVQIASRLAFDLFGLKNRDLGKTDVDSLFAGDETASQKLKDLVQATRENQETLAASFELVDTDAPDGVSSLELNLVPGKDGAVYAFVADCTEKAVKIRELENAIESADKHASEKTLFFAGVSHELRTPLNAIIGFSDMMRSRLFGPLPGKYAEYADLIHNSGQHMLDLIGDVLDLSKIEAGKYELHIDEFDAADVVRSSIKMVRPSADAAQLEIVTMIEDEPDLLVEADRKAVRQILLNLLSNAIKFTPKGGRISVTAKAVGDQLDITVEDTGTGIRPSELKHLGTPYSQAENANTIDARGSGLGLSLVKTLIDLHNGDFAISSHPGVGTKVEFKLPRRHNT
ncbi:MAG TPA: HAMP domain-containing histidine kinase [Hellea balneolensis]|uniref:histidine kinase n=1 Tax=Hellea balneolensis TaxID=287478 RepID=A0A7C5R7V9_9PROT|nr:HAMP domain-containing histidine kinase [Hellea balneolensis]